MERFGLVNGEMLNFVDLHRNISIMRDLHSTGQVGFSPYNGYLIFLAQFESMDFPPGIEAPTSRHLMTNAVDAYVPWFYWENLIWQPSSSFGISSFHVPAFEFYAPKDVKKFPWLQPSARNQNNAAAEPIKAISGKDKYEILRRFKLFKQFDIVEDYSDHYHASYGSTKMQVTRF